MLKDNSGLISLRKTKYGHVILGRNTPAKGFCIGQASLGDEKTNANNVLLVEGLKNNILSMS